MLHRYATLLLLALLPLAAEAQITLDQSDYPLQVGSAPYISLSTSNEDGANTAAIEDLISRSGSDQTYDMTGITFEDQLTGTITVQPGATGPAAEIEPLDQASLTAEFPFVLEEEDLTAEGTIYFYHLVTDEEAYELGSFFLGEADDQTIALLIRNTPDGQLDAEFPYTFGSTWSSMFTQILDFDVFEFTTEVEETSEVDGWGTLLLPDVEGGIPALRVKVTTTTNTNGVESTDVCYEFRTMQPLGASVCEGVTQFGEPPTAELTRLGTVTTAGEESTEPLAAALGAAYPNPASETVTLEYVVPQSGNVELTLYDVLGRQVQHVVSGSRSVGVYAETIDVTKLAPGLYLARLTINGEQSVRSLRVVR